MKRAIRVVCLAIAASLASCSAKDNLLGLTVPADHKEEFDNQIDLGQAAYDRGDLTSAERYAKAALGLDPGSEEAAILYGFVALGLAGGDPYALARALIASSAASSSGAASTLGALQGQIGLQPSELLLLGTLDTTVSSLPVIIPACAENVRPEVPRLTNINDAILVICPFVDPAILNPLDLEQHCTPTSLSRSQPDQAHFLWAFAHLAEALAFDQVLTYSTTGTGEPNIQARVDQITAESKGSTDPTTFISGVTSLSNTMQQVLPVSGICSNTAPTTQLTAMLQDLEAVEAGFARLPGTPASIRTTLNKALGTIQASGQQSSSSADSVAALKAQFSSSVAQSLASSINSQVASLPQPLSPDQKAQLCAAFANIAAGSGQSPSLCGTAN